jgi:hypothetical protein
MPNVVYGIEEVVDGDVDDEGEGEESSMFVSESGGRLLGCLVVGC